jgi:hypothetical protein
MSHNRDLSAAAAQLGFHSSNIGIGSEAPRYALDVYNSNLLVSGPSAGNIILEDRSVGDSSRPFHVVSSDGGKFVINRSNRNASGTTTSSVNSLTLSSSGNLGLGPQTNPAANIHISDLSANGYELKITGNALQFNRSSNSYIDQLHDTGSILFRMTSSNTEAMRITSDRRIGINDSSPNFHLDVDGNIGIREGQVLTWHDGSGNKAGDIYMDSSDNFVFRNTSSVAERLRITSAGDMGLGSSSPNHYNNYTTLTINGATGGELDFESGGTLLADTFANSGGYYFTTRTAIPIRFHTTNSGGTHAERLQITANGLLGINHASAAQISKVLTIRPANDDGIRFIRPGNTSSNPGAHLDLTTTTSGSVYPSGEAYTVKYKTYNCDQIFETYEGGGTGGHIVFKTAPQGGTPSDRMVLDYNGFLRVPNQPIFQATGQPSHRYMNSWHSVDLPDWNFVTQNGSNFNNSNGRFTAPVAGKYYFIFTAMYTNPSTNDVATYIIKNGTTEVLSNNHSGGGSSNGHQWNDITVHAIVNMAANDWVSSRMVGNSSSTCYFYGASGSRYGGFSGFLIG